MMVFFALALDQILVKPNGDSVVVEIEGFKPSNQTKDSGILTLSAPGKVAPLASFPIDLSVFTDEALGVEAKEVDGQARVIFTGIQNDLNPIETPNGVQFVFSKKTNLANENTASNVLDDGSKALEGSPTRELGSLPESLNSGEFKGAPISINVKGADVRDVLRLIGTASGFNMVVGSDVKGELTLRLDEVPWDHVLSVVLKTLNLGAERSGSVLRIVSLNSLSREQQMLFDAKNASLKTEPKVTRVFDINYANPANLKKLLETFLKEGNEIPAIEFDPRTNRLIVEDRQEKISKIESLVKSLDKETPQVLVEAKVVEVSDEFLKEIDGDLGFGSADEPGYFGSFSGGNPVDGLIGSPGIFAGGSAISTLTGSPSSSGGLGFSQAFSGVRLNLLLKLGEKEKKLETIATPKLVVLSGEKAKVVQGTPVRLLSKTVVDGREVPFETIVPANVSLDVTPKVTADQNILLDLDIIRDEAEESGVGASNRSIQSRVLVRSGSTLVLGGVSVSRDIEISSGFPWLRKIPLLGIFFGSESKQKTTRKLYIFITPKILDGQTASEVAKGDL